mmetsp:Transcript_16772/g.42380  ORF Transcript_16772/g.42380 Transcript_16772/m.42380 type:complete len:214 (-) Transcript_16772:144-785(-)
MAAARRVVARLRPLLPQETLLRQPAQRHHVCLHLRRAARVHRGGLQGRPEEGGSARVRRRRNERRDAAQPPRCAAERGALLPRVAAHGLRGGGRLRVCRLHRLDAPLWVLPRALLGDCDACRLVRPPRVLGARRLPELPVPALGRLSAPCHHHPRLLAADRVGRGACASFRLLVSSGGAAGDWPHAGVQRPSPTRHLCDACATCMGTKHGTRR